MNKSQAYSKKVYQEYLDWFQTLASTVDGRIELKCRQAYLTHDADGKELPVVPYDYSMWYLMDANSGCDFEVMAERAQALRRKNAYKISEASKHVGGNPNAPLLSAEFMANARAWKLENARRREADPEWMAHDSATREANRVSQSGPDLYAKWESENKPVEVKSVFKNISLPRKSMFKNILFKLRGLFSKPEQKPRERFSDDFKDQWGIK
jgi:hypothetical protein